MNFGHNLFRLFALLILIFGSQIGQSLPRKICEGHLSSAYTAKITQMLGLPRSPGAYLGNLSLRRDWLSSSQLQEDLLEMHYIQRVVIEDEAPDIQVRMSAWIGQGYPATVDRKRESVIGERIHVLDEEFDELLRLLSFVSYLGRTNPASPPHAFLSPWFNPDYRLKEHLLFLAKRYPEVYVGIWDVIKLTRLSLHVDESSFGHSFGRLLNESAEGQNFSVRSGDYYVGLQQTVIGALLDIYFYGLARFYREPRSVDDDFVTPLSNDLKDFIVHGRWYPVAPEVALRDLRTIELYLRLHQWGEVLRIERNKFLSLARLLALNKTREFEFNHILAIHFLYLRAKDRDAEDLRTDREFTDGSFEIIRKSIENATLLDMEVEEISHLVSQGRLVKRLPGFHDILRLE